ncbi:MAG: 4a-hydroxytetrahydrobiopterin dehydratase [Gammaproteobacteria bacterium]|jgi:4a-hydroxytetrahydrobiopterin dehydratase|nr:4a-hydroxytetrahydrobiopterin dehydratase [Gammaproteobacteria bacterium]MBQ09011.1 4a-hydroxytetrahydrobiopterin dehydratase [Gammaproteobacteria bacterium]MDP6146887.1 4a-hydroxytetrahydrobiopterin dehydratase [Gammaproteobacteria bacterium]HJL80697.1 4a-hydroxytetrahydrobiopterin dehydratase [Gammaproteobacteria bacterium]HJM09450.1 4a-hydroxytetrahydrobiopterin dehydratase [Gammaproteobacteria bacterium]|tara:strand:- start:6307 stop:6648 length:342 start_codon:yes stop_codon:yes gene_type:complete
MDIEELEKKHCVPCEGGVDPLDQDAVKQIAKAIDPEWKIAEDFKSISKEFKFDGYNKTISFVNAVAWIAESEDHHPDLTVKYGSCAVLYTTHAIGGLSENDFICAKKIDNILS